MASIFLLFAGGHPNFSKRTTQLYQVVMLMVERGLSTFQLWENQKIWTFLVWVAWQCQCWGTYGRSKRI